jgi:hypothetical protein
MCIKKPKFALKISGSEYFNEEFSCYGDQLVKILTPLSSFFKNDHWYVFDVSASTKEANHPFLSPELKDTPMKLSMEDLIDKSSKIIQFDSGVFMSFQKNKIVHWDPNFLPLTESEEGLQHPLADLEIRAFDYSYFEIYGNNKEIKEKILKELSI